MTTVELKYTPNYNGAGSVHRQEKFSCPTEAQKFIARMKRMYKDTTIITT